MNRDRQANPRAAISPAVQLTDRQRSVLRAVVEDYVLTAVPVGSKSLVSRYGLAVSPATVRSAMAELEALGLLTHPHTSAGRVPSDLGYRLYVESLMREAELDSTDRLMIRHQFSQVQLTSNDWLRLAASCWPGTRAPRQLSRPPDPPGAVRTPSARGTGRRHAPAWSSCSATGTWCSGGSTAPCWSGSSPRSRPSRRRSTRPRRPSTPSSPDWRPRRCAEARRACGPCRRTSARWWRACSRGGCR